MIDPLERWRGLGDKPDYAGLLTFAALPYTQDPAELRRRRRGDRGRADRRSRLRPARRPLRPARDPRRELPAGPAPGGEDRRGAGAEGGGLRRRAGDPGRPGPDPRGDRGDGRPGRARGRRADRARRRPLDRRAGHVRRRRGPRPGGPRPLRHAHRHGHRGLRRRGLARDADVPARRGRPRRSARYVQIGLRGYWPGEAEFAWQAERGITSFFMHDVRDLGIREVVARTVGVVGAGPVFLTVDVDVLDPAFAPGTGTPEPGGMTSADLLWACRALAQQLELVGRRRGRGDPDRGRLGRRDRARRRADRPRDPDRDRAPPPRLGSQGRRAALGRVLLASNDRRRRCTSGRQSCSSLSQPRRPPPRRSRQLPPDRGLIPARRSCSTGRSSIRPQGRSRTSCATCGSSRLRTSCFAFGLLAGDLERQARRGWASLTLFACADSSLET